MNRQLIKLEQWEKIISESMDLETLGSRYGLVMKFQALVIGQGERFGGDEFEGEKFYTQQVDDYNRYFLIGQIKNRISFMS